MATYEISITVSQQPVILGPPGSTMTTQLEVYNGKVGLNIPDDFPTEIPGGVLNQDDVLYVRLINDLPHPAGIHWHGIELQNNADGTPVTQAGLPGGDLQTIGGATVGGTYLYKFTVPRPGVFWFHPHHFHSTNRVFRGSYGMIVVTDPNETALASVLPTDRHPIVLSDITVCEAAGPGQNEPFDPTLPWAGPGGVLPVQPGLTPKTICETPVDENGSTTDSMGNPYPALAAGEVPNIQRPSGRVNEGLTVLTNGRNVGPRSGTPFAPGTITDLTTIETIPVGAGQGIRFQFVNCATTRYFRLRLTDNSGNDVPLVRIGGEGGLLDDALLDGGQFGNYDTKYDEGEILLPPSSRADVVAAIPNGVSGVLTMWTRDFPRMSGLGANGPYAGIPTVPVLHLEVSLPTVSPPYSITGGRNDASGTSLRSSISGQAQEDLGLLATSPLLDPAGFTPMPKFGSASPTIRLTNGPPPRHRQRRRFVWRRPVPQRSAHHLHPLRSGR